MAILQFQNGPVVAATSEPIPLDIEQTGPRGPKGWTPVISGVSDGGRHLLFIDWTGGVNPKPTAGYLGENSLVADPAQALSLTGKGLANISQEPNADLKFTYSDGSTQTIPAYFAPMIAAAAQVAQDTQTVSDDKDTVLQARQDVENRQTDIAGRHQDIVIKHADVVYAHNHIMNMEVAVDADAQAVEISRGVVQTHADNFEAQKNYFNAQLSEIDADVVAIDTIRQNVEGMQGDVTSKRNETQSFRDQAQTARDVALSAKWFPVVPDATTARTLTLADAGKELRFTNVGAVTVTVPPQSSVAWAADTEIVIAQAGAGQVTIVPGAGVVINTSETLKTARQYAYTGLKRVGVDVWDFTGERQFA